MLRFPLITVFLCGSASAAGVFPAPVPMATSTSAGQVANLGGPGGAANLDAFGELSVQPVPSAPGIADGTTLGTSQMMIARSMVNLGNEFTAAVQGVAGVTNSTAAYEKATVYARIACYDPSVYGSATITRDCVGAESQAVIQPGNMAGRAWSFDGLVVVSPGADGYAVGYEVGVVNNGADQPVVGKTNSKVGLHLVGSGQYGGTVAIYPNGAWHDAFICNPAIVLSGGSCFRVWNGASDLFRVNPDGSALAGRLTVTGTGPVASSFPLQGLSAWWNQTGGSGESDLVSAIPADGLPGGFNFYSQNAEGALTLVGTLGKDGSFALPVKTVAQLSACASGNVGAIAEVSDAANPSWNGALTGGGSVQTLAVCAKTGASSFGWTVH
jgi:hypothetical protein